MAEYDMHSNVQAFHCIEAAIHTTSQTGASVDTLGFESLEYIIHVGDALVGGGFLVTLEGSDDTGFTVGNGAVAAAEILGTLPDLIATDTDLVLRVGSVDKRRFQRIILTEVDTVTAGIVGVTAILGNPVSKPVADQST